MSWILPPASPGGDTSGSDPPEASGLVAVLDGVEEPVTAATFDDPVAVNQLATRLEEADRTAGVTVTEQVLDLIPARRLAVTDFIVSLASRVVLRATGQEFTTALDALAAVVRFDPTAARRTAAGRQMVVDAAVLEIDDSSTAGQVLACRLRGCGFNGLRVNELVAEHRRRRQELMRAARSGDPGGRPLADALPDAPQTAGLLVPSGYDVSTHGVFRHGASIFPFAIFIVAVGRDERRGGDTVSVCWWDGQRYCTQVVDRVDVADRRRIVNLAAFGISVTSENAAALVEWLAAFLIENVGRLPVEVVTDRLGLQPGGGFLTGDTLIVPESTPGPVPTVRFRGGDVGDAQIVRGYRSAGTMDGWLRLLALVRPHPKIMFAVWASLVPVLMAFFRIANFVVSFAGPTTRGKTTALRVSASTCGCPDDGAENTNMNSCNSTAVFRDRLAAVCCHHPHYLDDTQHAADLRDVIRTIYGVTQGHAKSRGTPAGIAAQPPLHTVLFITGEQSAHDLSKQAGGAIARVLEFWDSPFEGEVDSVLPAEINRLVKADYGHALPAVVRFLLNNPHRHTEWEGRIRQLQLEYEARAGRNGVAARQAAHLAAVRLAAEIGHEALALDGPQPDPVAPVYDSLVNGTADADRARAALEYTLDWAVANRQYFRDSEQASSSDHDRQPHHGWLGRWELDRPHTLGRTTDQPSRWVGVVRRHLDRVLEEGGHAPQAVVRTWKDRGWIEFEGGRCDKLVRLEGQPVRMVVIPSTTIQQFRSAASERGDSHTVVG